MRLWWSAVLLLGVPDAQVQAPAPDSVWVVAEDDEGVDLAWTPVEGAVGYRIYREIAVSMGLDEHGNVVELDEMRWELVLWGRTEAAEIRQPASGRYAVAAVHLIEGEEVESEPVYATPLEGCPVRRERHDVAVAGPEIKGGQPLTAVDVPEAPGRGQALSVGREGHPSDRFGGVGQNVPDLARGRVQQLDPIQRLAGPGRAVRRESAILHVSPALRGRRQTPSSRRISPAASGHVPVLPAVDEAAGRNDDLPVLLETHQTAGERPLDRVAAPGAGAGGSGEGRARAHKGNDHGQGFEARRSSTQSRTSLWSNTRRGRAVPRRLHVAEKLDPAETPLLRGSPSVA